MVLENIDYSKCIIIGVNTVDSKFNTSNLRLVSEVITLNLTTERTEIKSSNECINNWSLFVDLSNWCVYKSNLDRWNFKCGKFDVYDFDGFDVVYIDGNKNSIENYIVTSNNYTDCIYYNLNSGYYSVLFKGFDFTSGEYISIDDLPNHLLVGYKPVDEMFNNLSLSIDGFKAFRNTLVFDSINSSTLLIPSGYKYVIFKTFTSILELVVPPTCGKIIGVRNILDLKRVYLPKGSKLESLFESYPKLFPKKVEIIEY